MANVQDLDLDCFGNLKLSNLCDYKPSFSAGRMFMKKMVILMCCLMWINFFGLPAAAQYVRGFPVMKILLFIHFLFFVVYILLRHHSDLVERLHLCRGIL